jgi:hypothetical protein
VNACPLSKKIFWLIAIAACSPTISATQASFDCRKATEYRLVVVQNLNRKKDSDSGVPEDVNILAGDEVISRIELPTESEVKNFSLNSIEKTKAGFTLTTDWGGDGDHYEIQFNFRRQGALHKSHFGRSSLRLRRPM